MAGLADALEEDEFPAEMAKEMIHYYIKDSVKAAEPKLTPSFIKLVGERYRKDFGGLGKKKGSE